MAKVLNRLFGRARSERSEAGGDTDWPADPSYPAVAADPAPRAATAVQRTGRGQDPHVHVEPAGDGNPRFPGFLASAIGRAIGRGERAELLRARIALRDVFTPSQPVTDRSFFAGRLDVLTQLIDVIEGQRSHVVIYGERGIGKTSLLHILADVARESQYIVVYDSCGAHSNFDEMFRGILRDIPLLFHSSVSPTSAEAERGLTLADRLGEGPVDARQFGELCAQITGTRIMIILDEYDRVEDPEFRRSVAELIKNLSDRAARVQLVISGVASNLQELVGYIPSIRRNVVGLPMPRLTVDEVRALIAIGENAAGVRFGDDAIDAITVLANGSPYITRLLAHHASEVAIDQGRLNIALADLPSALDRVVREAESRVGRKAAEMAQNLAASAQRGLAGAAARAASTPDGWFLAEDAAQHLPGGDVASVRASLSHMTGPGGLLLTAEDDGLRRFRFRDDALPIYLHMLIARGDFASQTAGEPRRA